MASTAGADERAFVDQNLLDASGGLRGNVDFGGLDPTVSAGDPGRKPGSVINAQAVISAGDAGKDDDRDNPVLERFHARTSSRSGRTSVPRMAMEII